MVTLGFRKYWWETYIISGQNKNWSRIELSVAKDKPRYYISDFLIPEGSCRIISHQTWVNLKGTKIIKGDWFKGQCSFISAVTVQCNSRLLKNIMVLCLVLFFIHFISKVLLEPDQNILHILSVSKTGLNTCEYPSYRLAFVS